MFCTMIAKYKIRLITGPLPFFGWRIFVFARGVYIVDEKKLLVFQSQKSRSK